MINFTCGTGTLLTAERSDLAIGLLDKARKHLLDNLHLL